MIRATGGGAELAPMVGFVGCPGFFDVLNWGTIVFRFFDMADISLFMDPAPPCAARPRPTRLSRKCGRSMFAAMPKRKIVAESEDQMGWRLGGKGASSRGVADRIEEYGLHLWMGFSEPAAIVIAPRFAVEVLTKRDAAGVITECSFRSCQTTTATTNRSSGSRTPRRKPR